jgi:NitT/TauT family transport system substrate-binding protein
MFTTRSRLLRLATALLAVAVTGAFSAQPAEAQNKKVTLGWTSADALYGPWFYGQDNGIFAKYGIDSNLVFFDSGTKGIQALIGGNVDVLCADAGALMSAKFAGFDGKFVGSTMGVLTGSVYTAKDISSKAGIKGKRWGISSFGSEAHLAARIALSSFGIDPKDVTIVQLGNQGNRLAALDAGQIQVTTFLPPVSRRAETNGYIKIADLPDLAPDYFSVGPAVSAAYLKANRDTVEKVMMGLAEATAAYKKDRAGGVKVLQKYLKIENAQDAEAAYDYYAPLHPANLRPSQKSFDIHLENSTDPKAKTASIRDFYDPSILDDLDSKGFFKNLK